MIGELTAYERASLRLKAWHATNGWGTTTPVLATKEAADGVMGNPHWQEQFKPWDWKTRKKYATELYEWLVGD